jgi:hypothetical protein
MEPNTDYGKAREQYDAAHAMHYQEGDLPHAIKLYQDVMGSYPESREASYSRSQILNIVSSVVPERELFEAQVEMVLAKFKLKNHPH